MPVVTVLARPSGLPTAMTGSPTVTFEESPSADGLRSSGASFSLMTARSVVGSVPTIVASNRRPSVSVTCTSPYAPATTWLLVTMWPSSSMMTPEPWAPPPLPSLIWMATTDCWTALATASQFGSSDVESETGTVSLLDWPMVASDAGRSVEPSPSDSACVRPPVATAATIAAAAAAEVTGSQRLRLRCVGTPPCGAAARAVPRSRRPAAAPAPGRARRRAGRPPTGRGGRPRTGRRAPLLRGVLLGGLLLRGVVLRRGALGRLVRGALVRRGGGVRRRERVGRVRRRRQRRVGRAAAASRRRAAAAGWCASGGSGRQRSAGRSRRSQGWSSSVCPPWSRYITSGRPGGRLRATWEFAASFEWTVSRAGPLRRRWRPRPTSRSPSARRPRRSTRTSTTLSPGPGRRARAAGRRRR